MDWQVVLENVLKKINWLDVIKQGGVSFLEAIPSVVAILAILGIILYWDLRKRRKRIAWVKVHGDVIETDFLRVYCEREDDPKCKNAQYYIFSTWKDPDTGEVREFESKGFDQEPMVRVKKITVFVDPKDKKLYFMDVSFLE